MTKFKHNNTFRRAALTLLALIMTCAAAWAYNAVFTISDATPQPFTFSGNQIKPIVTWVTITDDNNNVITQYDQNQFTVTYGTNINAGETRCEINVRITAEGAYQDWVFTKYYPIAKRPMFVNINNCEKHYGEADPTFTWQLVDDNDVQQDSIYNLRNRLLPRRLNGHLTRTAGEDMGDYTISYDGTNPIELANYQVTVNDGTLTITAPNPDDFSVNADGTEYTIHTAKGWGYFCDALQDNETYNRFSGKTVKLGANISVSRMAGNDAHPFTGTFNGDGKTLTFNYGSEGTPSNEDYIAPFRYTDGATISGLHVSGNIYTQHTHSAGIIGLASGTTTVSNCRSSINIISSINGDGTHGGLIAWTWTGSTTNITGCLFDGSIQSASGYATDQCGGFVGWRNATINVTNSLLTADLSTIGDDTGNYPSCTFVRSGVSSITNSYYTAALGTVQGKLRHSITAGANTTVANAGTATDYDVSGITSYGTGILYGGVLYAGNGDAVSLTLTHQDPPEGYTFNSYIPSAGTLNGTTLTMPDEDVIISAPWAPIGYAITYNLEGGNLPTGQSNPESYTIESNDIELVNPIKSGYNFVGWTGTGLNGPTQTVIIAHGSMGIREYTAIWSVSVNYINENGVEQTVTALPLTGSETILDPGWYVVENTNPNGVDLAYTEGLSCSGGDLNLILCDGAEMTVTGAYTYDAITLYGAYTLTIYGQSQQSGKLTLTGSEFGKCIHTNDGSILMNGGIVNATADTDGAIECYSFTMNGGSFSATSNGTDYNYDHAIEIGDSFTFNGGNFSAISANASGIVGAWSSVNLSWTNTSDSFYVSSLGQVSINIAEGKDFVDEDNTLHTHANPGDIVGKTLRPFNGCYLPKHLTANAITTSTATLNWEAGDEETQWQVSWSTDGGSNWSTPVTVNDVPQYEITSLSPETTVQAQVKSVCDESVYSAPISITFTTRSLCDAPESLTCNSYSTSAVLGWTGYQDSYNVRYCTVTFGDAATATEDFEHDNEMPEGWTKLDLGDGANTAELGIFTGAAQDGTYGFRFSSFNGNENGSFDQYLISPELNNLSALSFAFKSSQGTNDVFRVGYSTTTNDVSAFTWGDETASANSWATYTENPGNIPANAKYFAINYTAVYQYRLYIDNITYTYTPLIVGTWNETNTSVTSPLTISGLTPETPYAWQVQGSNCDGNNGTTEWSEAGTFTTLAGIDLTIAGYEEGNGGWVFIASPVAGSITPNTVTNIFSATEYDLYRFNQSAANGKEWQNYKAHTSDFNLVNGQGYLYATKETKTLVFTGEFNTDNTKTVDLVYDNNAELKGWNLVGNPFITTATLSQPYYRMNDEGTALKTETETSAVAAMEGVFVQATGDDQTVTFTAQTRGGEQSAVAMLNVLLGKVPEPVEGPTQNNGVSTSSTTLTLDNAIVRFDGGQTLEKFSFREGSTKLYIPQGGTDYAIVCAEGHGELPVNFEAEKNGTYTLSFSSQEVSFSYLHLIDNMTGDDIDLLPHYKGGRGDSQPATYTFQAKTTDYASRFKLVFVTDGEDSPSTGSETFAYYNGSEWMISNTGRATLQVVDAMGRVLRSETINGNATININGLSAGVYMLRLINSEDVRVQKIVVR